MNCQRNGKLYLTLSIFPRYSNRNNQIALYNIITYTILKNKIKIHLVKIITSRTCNLLITPFIILVFVIFLFLTKLEQYIQDSIKKMLPVKVKVLSFQGNEIVTFGATHVSVVFVSKKSDICRTRNVSKSQPSNIAPQLFSQPHNALYLQPNKNFNVHNMTVKSIVYHLFPLVHTRLSN